MRSTFFAVVVLLAGCASSPTGPTNARMTLAISQSSLPVGGTAVVTATMIGSNGRDLVRFSSSLGTFAPPEAYTVGGVATTTFTATRSGIGAIGALSGRVAEQLQVRIGEFPALPEINTTPPAPTVFLSCHNSGTAGVPAICSVSGSHLQTLAINWGDGSPEQSLSPTTASVAHVFARAGSYAVSVRGVDGLGRVATAGATATIAAAPPPPPVLTPPVVSRTSVFMSQEAPLGTGTCAAFNVSATPATDTRITSIIVKMPDGSQERFDFTSSARFTECGLTAGEDILAATATDSNGFQATYQLIVR